MIPVFDIEAVNWTLPIAVGFFDGKNYYEFLKTSDDCDVVWEFLSSISKTHRGIKLYAHNAANYDNRFILDRLTKHNQTVRFLAGLGKLVWVEPNISFEDSYLLLGRNLAAVCEAFNVPRKLEWDHMETSSLFERPYNIWEREARLDAFRAYLRRDCTSLSMALETFSRELLDLFGITPSSTLALTAVKAFSKRFFPVDDIAPNEEFEKFIRLATYGSRNEIYRRYGENIYMYDVKGMFVSCYDVPIPIGKMHWIQPNIDKGTLAEAKVKVPDMFIGPLPHRHPDPNSGRLRLIFPTGEFKDWWDIRLLRYAVSKGVDITLIRQLECEEKPILKDFGQLMGDLRNIDNAELSKIWKIFGLRLSGKFGQHRLRTETKHIKDIEDFTGYCPIDENEVYHERTIYLPGKRSPYIKPAVNMRVRSEACIRHTEQLIETGSIYYCDTDSIYTDKKLEIGNFLGGLQLVDFAVRAFFIGCKLYGYVNRNGILKQKTAGFRDYPLSEDDFEKALKGERIPLTFQSAGNWKEILKGRGVSIVEKVRLMGSTEFNNRIVDGLETYPIKLLG